MNKLVFPKGSLKFTPIISKEVKKDLNLKSYTNEKNFLKFLHRTFKGKKGLNLDKIPTEILQANESLKKSVRNTRNNFKLVQEFQMAKEYEITFKHPKWTSLIGEVKLKSNKTSIKESLEIIRKEFKSKKDVYRTLRVREKITNITSYRSEIKYNVSGGIIHMPTIKEGVFVKFLKDQEKKIVFSRKTPKDNDNYIGVELEFLCDLNQEKLGLELFDIGIGKNVTLTTDASIKCCVNERHEPTSCAKHQNKLFAHELCILTKESNYKEILMKACEVLSKANAQVNKSCGMHVHLDMRNRNSEQAYQNLISSQGILFKMNPKSRTELYAKKVTNRNMEEVVNATSGNARYSGINVQAIKKHNTIECRIHSGTIEFTKITNWITILNKIANKQKRIVKNFVSLANFCKEFDIEMDLKFYIQQRMEKFSPGDDELADIEAEVGVA